MFIIRVTTFYQIDLPLNAAATIVTTAAAAAIAMFLLLLVTAARHALPSTTSRPGCA